MLGFYPTLLHNSAYHSVATVHIVYGLKLSCLYFIFLY